MYKLSFKEFLIEKISKSDYSSVLSDKHFRMGFEVEYYDEELQDVIDGALDNNSHSKVADDLPKIIAKVFKSRGGRWKTAKYGAYHKNADSNNVWRVETDTSLETQDSGVEIISPVMNIQEGLTELKNVLTMVKNVGFTDKTTGLHINLSYKGKDLYTLDVLKMILFLEEGSIYKKFPERIGSEYAKSMTDFLNSDKPTNKELKNIIKHDSNHKKIQKLSDKFLIKDYDRLFGINITNISAGDDSRIEFRYLGGTKYESKFEDIKTNISRFAYLLKLGIDPNYKKDEYLRKLGKFTAKNSTNLIDEPTDISVPYVIYKPNNLKYFLNHDKLVKGKPTTEKIKAIKYFLDKNHNVFGVSDLDAYELKKPDIIDSMSKAELDAKIKKMPKAYEYINDDAENDSRLKGFEVNGKKYDVYKKVNSKLFHLIAVSNKDGNAMYEDDNDMLYELNIKSNDFKSVPDFISLLKNNQNTQKDYTFYDKKYVNNNDLEIVKKAPKGMPLTLEDRDKVFKLKYIGDDIGYYDNPDVKYYIWKTNKGITKRVLASTLLDIISNNKELYQEYKP